MKAIKRLSTRPSPDLLISLALLFVLSTTVSFGVSTKLTITPNMGERVLLCTGSGFKWVDLSTLLEEPGTDSSQLHDCPLCHIHYVAAKSDVSPLLSTFGHFLVLQSRRLSSQMLTDSLQFNFSLSRAPPYTLA